MKATVIIKQKIVIESTEARRNALLNYLLRLGYEDVDFVACRKDGSLTIWAEKRVDKLTVDINLPYMYAKIKTSACRKGARGHHRRLPARTGS